MFLTAQGGLLGPFAWLFGKILDVTYNLLADGNGIANLGICIIVFTFILKLILFPLTFKQQKSSKINMLIQPEIQKIQKKYKDKKDQESLMKQNQEMQEVYNKYGTSAATGCLPALIQFPIIMAMYRVIQNIPAYVGQIKVIYTPIAEGIMKTQGENVQQFLIDFVDENKISSASYAISSLKTASEVGVNNVIDVISNFGATNLTTLVNEIGMNDTLMSNVDKINEIYSFALGINISEAPGYHLSWALIIPIFSVVLNYISMKVSMSGSQASSDPTAASMTKSMMITMPIMSFFIGISMPAGIGIYWAMGYLFTLITQLIMNAYYNHANMEKILEKQIEKAAKKRAKRGGKKTFMERMMDSSQEAQEELEKREAMRKNAASSLKNYVPSESSQKAVEKKQGKKYKEGSIGSKANIMMNYNNYKEEN